MSDLSILIGALAIFVTAVGGLITWSTKSKERGDARIDELVNTLWKEKEKFFTEKINAAQTRMTEADTIADKFKQRATDLERDLVIANEQLKLLPELQKQVEELRVEMADLRSRIDALTQNNVKLEADLRKKVEREAFLVSEVDRLTQVETQLRHEKKAYEDVFVLMGLKVKEAEVAAS